MEQTVPEDPLGALAGLADPVRRRLYAIVASAPTPVSRDEAAAAAGLKRPLAAYHLDRLARDGLLDVHYERPPGRSGPGAGRPSKRYRRTAREFGVSLPPRQYETAARLLAEAVATSRSPAVVTALRNAATRLGTELGARITGSTKARRREALLEVLAGSGYEPYVDGSVVRMRNCPFHALSREHTELVCGMNLALMQGAAAADPRLAPALDPRPGECCVTFQRP